MNERVLTTIANNSILSKIAPHAMKGALKVEKHKPEILLVGGILTAVTAGVTFARAYKRHDEILEDVNDELEMTHAVIESNQKNAGKEFVNDDTGEVIMTVEEMSPQERAQALTPLYGVKLGLLIRNYGPAVLLAGASTYMILSSHGIMRGRNRNLAVALGASTEALRAYRARIVEEYGEDADLRAFLGLESRERVEVVKQENGRNKKIKSTENVIGEKPDPLQYSVVFDNTCQDFDPDSKELNLYWLKTHEEYLNLRLQVKGHLILNDVYAKLGFEPTAEGHLVGWNLDAPGDNYVSFRLDAPVNQNEGDPRFIINPNVNGVVYDYV